VFLPAQHLDRQRTGEERERKPNDWTSALGWPSRKETIKGKKGDGRGGKNAGGPKTIEGENSYILRRGILVRNNLPKLPLGNFVTPEVIS